MSFSRHSSIHPITLSAVALVISGCTATTDLAYERVMSSSGADFDRVYPKAEDYSKPAKYLKAYIDADQG